MTFKLKKNFWLSKWTKLFEISIQLQLTSKYNAMRGHISSTNASSPDAGYTIYQEKKRILKE